MKASPALPNPAISPSLERWETAYLAFETPEAEIAKFMRRLCELGAEQWPKDAQIVELFCGRGNGLHALNRLGFTRLEGVDLSARLLAQYRGPARLECSDCRKLSFPDASRDIAIVQGGLHHLPVLPQDLEQTVAEVQRVLRPGGKFMVVEPWLTPFLRLVHGVAGNPLVRRINRKVDALQTMIENEQQTYDQWLGQPDVVLGCLKRHFATETCRQQWGKLLYVGRRR